MTAATAPPIPAAIADAVKQHAKAQSLRKQAQELEDGSRQLLLDFFVSSPEAFNLECDDDTRKVKSAKLRAGEYEANIAFPYSQETPQRVPSGDPSEQLHKTLEDSFGGGFEHWFEIVYTFKLRQFLDDLPRCEQYTPSEKLKLARAVEKYTEPAIPPQALSPRLRSGSITKAGKAE